MPANSDTVDADTPLTVYTLRLTTSFDRGSAQSDPMAGVNVCLLALDGRAVLRRVKPVNDPDEASRSMDEICKVADDGMGANCAAYAAAAYAAAQPPPSWAAKKVTPAKLRFQEGSVDEVSFLAPELGPLAAILVAPEGGSWVLDEVHASSSRTKHMDRFVCRRRLGGRKGEPAAYLTPVPPGAVVYGSGEAAVVLTKEQAAALQARSMSDYGDLKVRMLAATALLTAGGSGVAALASGPSAAASFALGGVAGLAYQLLLQVGVDAAVPSGGGGSTVAAAAPAQLQHPSQQVRGLRALQQLLGSTSFRLLLVTAAVLAAAWYLQDSAAHEPSVIGQEPSIGPLGVPMLQMAPFILPSADAWQLGVGVLGFMMYKVALVGVTLSQGGDDVLAQGVQVGAAKQVERNM